MATVVSITNPITGAVERVDKLDATAQQIDDAVALAPQLSNPNLLDNWYFGNPVNQRGISSGNGPVNAYGIDRWKCLNAGTLTIGSDYIAIASNEHNYVLQQYIEPGRFAGVIGRTATLSALVKGNGRLKISLGSSNVQAYSDYFNYSDWTLVQMHGTIVSGTDYHIFVQARQGSGNCYVKAVKLELGSQQTLAHKDTSGNWVLNEIPDYGEQLLRCQRYAYVMNNSSPHYAAGFGHTVSTTQAQVFFHVPVKMRANPTVSFTAGSAWAIKCNGATVIPTSISAWFASDYVIGVKVTGTFPGANYNIDMTSNAGENIIFSADL